MSMLLCLSVCTCTIYVQLPAKASRGFQNPGTRVKAAVRHPVCVPETESGSCTIVVRTLISETFL